MNFNNTVFISMVLKIGHNVLCVSFARTYQRCSDQYNTVIHGDRNFYVCSMVEEISVYYYYSICGVGGLWFDGNGEDNQEQETTKY